MLSVCVVPLCAGLFLKGVRMNTSKNSERVPRTAVSKGLLISYWPN